MATEVFLASLCGYIATIATEWVALIGWCSPVLKCSVRDRFIGWDDETKLKRLHLITNNVRFLILPWIRINNLASKVLSLTVKILSSDFQKVYGHPVYLRKIDMWLRRLQSLTGKAIAMDGKTLRGSGKHLLSAVLHWDYKS